MKPQISILGCGWLGLPLAKYLVENGYQVKGSTTTSEKLEVLKINGVNPFKIQLNEAKIIGDVEAFLKDSETLIINVPPGLRRNPKKNHAKEMAHVLNKVKASDIKHLIYTSSTSVFENKESIPLIYNDTIPNGTSNSAKQLISIEKEIQKSTNFRSTIIRFGGLFDEKRHPGKMLSGKLNSKNPEAHINLIHRIDCILVITSVLINNLWNKTFNAVYPFHPKKKTYYESYCKAHNLQYPAFEISEKSKGKIVDGIETAQLLNISYRHKP